MGTKYLSDKIGEPCERGFVDLDAGVDRLSGNETVLKILGMIRYEPRMKRITPEKSRGPSPASTNSP